MRAETELRDLPRVAVGPQWSAGEAEDQVRSFLDAMVGERPVQPAGDSIEFARANSLTILFGSDEQAIFEAYLARMPPEMADRWRDLLSGGARSEAFGPLTLREKLDEHQVEQALRSGRKQRVINVLAALIVLAGLGVGGYFGWNALGDRGQRTRGTLRFASVDTIPSGGIVPGGLPVAEVALTAGLTRDVAVVLGEGPPEDRIVTAPFSDYLFPPGAITASLFSYGGKGEVVFVGPSGFPERACLIASVATADLRPLDTVWHGNCLDPIGHRATIRCLGDNALALEITIPEGETELPEGGVGFADTIRVQSISDPGTKYEVLSARATMTVPVDSEVVIPAFGGGPGDSLVFDLGEGRAGECALTDAVVAP